MTTKQLKKKLFNEGIEASSLDSIVDECAHQMADAANQGGIDDQLDFLTETCGKDAKSILTALGIDQD
jgi:hypothetical protein